MSIDPCEHGIWLDTGELDLILDRLKEDPTFMEGVQLRLGDIAH